MTVAGPEQAALAQNLAIRSKLAAEVGGLSEGVLDLLQVAGANPETIS